MKLVAVLLALLVGAMGPVAFLRQPLVCGEHFDMKQTLGKGGEWVHGAGLITPVQLAELWVNDHTGTWSLVMVAPNGWACMVIFGRTWVTYDKSTEGKAL